MIIPVMGEIVKGLIFFLLFVFIFYPPGYFLIQKRLKDLNDWEIVLLSLSPTIILFVFLSLGLSLINLRQLLLPINFIVSILVIFKYGIKIFSPFKIFTKEKILFLLILTGIVVQGFINFPSGFRYDDGLLFWSSQGHDGIWHVALMEEAKKSMPFENPLIAGLPLVNYHYLIDIFMGEFVRMFGLFTSLDAYFRYFPVMFSFLLSLSVFSFVNRWKNKSTAYWAMFFTFGTGSFGYIVKYLQNGVIFGGETVFWASQNNTILGNPPHTAAFIFLTTFLLTFYLWITKKDRFWLVMSLLLGAFLGGFKVSGGLTLLFGMGLLVFVDVLFNRKIRIVLPALFLGFTNYIIVRSMTVGAASFLIFEPWWFIRTMVVSGDRLNWIDHELRRQHYIWVGTWKAWLRVIQLETTAFAIFLFGNLGMRFLGLFILIYQWVQMFKPKKLKLIEVLLLGMILGSFAMPILFIQKGISYNNIQFIQYFLLLVGFYAAIFTDNVMKRVKNTTIKTAFAIIVVTFAVPTVIGNFNEFYGPGRKPLAVVTNEELSALNFLKNITPEDSVILSVPFEKYLNERYKSQPWPIYTWYPTAYIPAIASRRTYLSSEEQVDITGYDYKERLNNMLKFFSQKDFEWNKEFLNNSGVDYVYVAENQMEEPLKEFENNLKLVFSNSQVKIYKVND